jgi:altronate hydrolase
MNRKAITINPIDNVAVALSDLQSGTTITVNNAGYKLVNDIKAKHKFALKTFDKDQEIIMYGLVVGMATQAIDKGELLTTQNVKHSSSKISKKTENKEWLAPDVSKWQNRNFLGYKRKDGQVGTQNIWLFFPLVFCENKNIEILKDTFEQELGYFEASKYRKLLRSVLHGNNKDNGQAFAQKESLTKNPLKNIELKFITHPGGCGAIRQDAEELSKLLAGYVNNPNVVGATVLSLGCQNLQIETFKKSLKEINPDFNKPILIYEQQQIGTADKMLNKAIEASIKEIFKADKQEREAMPLSALNIGLECGGSDGFSGISANPVLGMVSDMVVALGGSVILSEFPELCGVEQDIVNRCINNEDAALFLKLMQQYEKSVVDAGSGFDMNPSPGNIKDGLITDAMKSAGAAKKAGSSPIVQVMDYGGYVSKKGLSLLCTPGNDVESTTIMAGAGSNIILFTTGLGTPTGNPISPVIKVASNTELATKMSDIIDIDAGTIIKGEKSIAELADDLMEIIIDTASGRIKTKAMLNGQNDFIPWRRGVSL